MTRHWDDLLRPADVAAEYGIGEARVRRLIHAGEVQALRIGRRMLVPRWELDRWVADNLTPRRPPVTHPTTAHTGALAS